MAHLQSRCLALALVLAAFSCNVYAVDGVILIDQNRALAGGVTPGDAPGFPVTLSQPGSYRLTGNLTVPDANTTAILVTADNVTIDLNGFSILGPTVCVGNPVTSCSPTGTGKGVESAGQRGITVVNGTVRGMGSTGIFAGLAGVEKVHATSNGSAGIIVGFGSVVSGNRANFNGAAGFSISCPSSVVDNTAYGNASGNLIVFGAGCALANNAAP